MKNDNAKFVKVTGSDEKGYFLMFVDDDFVWECETRQDVYDQIELSKEYGFFDENTVISEF